MTRLYWQFIGSEWGSPDRNYVDGPVSKPPCARPRLYASAALARLADAGHGINTQTCAYKWSRRRHKVSLSQTNTSAFPVGLKARKLGIVDCALGRGTMTRGPARQLGRLGLHFGLEQVNESTRKQLRSHRFVTHSSDLTTARQSLSPAFLAGTLDALAERLVPVTSKWWITNTCQVYVHRFTGSHEPSCRSSELAIQLASK